MSELRKEDKALFDEKCQRREDLKSLIKMLEQEVIEIETELKALPQREDAYKFGTFHMFWKKTEKTEHSWDYIKEHEPMAYKKAEYKKASTYFNVSR